MKKILLLAFLVLGTISAQAQRPCYELIEQDGTYFGMSYGNSDSTSIHKIEWYSLDYKYYAIVYFQNNWSMGYTYGGYNVSDFYTVKDAFEMLNQVVKPFGN